MSSNTSTREETEQTKLKGDTPVLRLFALLEVIANKDQFFTLHGLVEATGLPKPTIHRMLQQLESVGILQRDGDRRYYTTGIRLRRLAENLLLNDTIHAARHAVLSDLVEQVGESCNLTARSGAEVLYLDRVDTAAPLRFYLHSGSRVPLHCTASGKLFISQMTPSQRKRLLGHVPLRKYTENTIVELNELEAEVQRIRQSGYAFDAEEYLPGLLCIGVLVPVHNKGKRSNLGLAIQAPTIRMPRNKALEFLPSLRRAAEALAEIEVEAVTN